MIEVFKTNINKREDAVVVMSGLKSILPSSKINFDLEDCDKVLRIETFKESIDEKKVIELLERYRFNCQVMDW